MNDIYKELNMIDDDQSLYEQYLIEGTGADVKHIASDIAKVYTEQADDKERADIMQKVIELVPDENCDDLIELIKSAFGDVVINTKAALDLFNSTIKNRKDLDMEDYHELIDDSSLIVSKYIDIIYTYNMESADTLKVFLAGLMALIGTTYPKYKSIFNFIEGAIKLIPAKLLTMLINGNGLLTLKAGDFLNKKLINPALHKGMDLLYDTKNKDQNNEELNDISSIYEKLNSIDDEESFFESCESRYHNESYMLEGTGADTKKLASDIVGLVSEKQDKKEWADTANKIIDAIPDNFLDDAFEAIKEKVKDTKVSREQKKKLIDASEGNLSEQQLKDADTLGKILEFVDVWEWSKDNPGLIKGLMSTVILILGLFEQTLILEILAIVIAFLPDEWVSKIYSFVYSLSLPGAIGHIANKAYKMTQKKNVNNVEAIAQSQEV